MSPGPIKSHEVTAPRAVGLSDRIADSMGFQRPIFAKVYSILLGLVRTALFQRRIEGAGAPPRGRRVFKWHQAQ
jgi:hypothetical protein